jgi:hypothetical protein
LYLTCAILLYDDIAGKQNADVLLNLQRLIRERGVARTKNFVPAEVNIQFLFQRCLNVYFGKNAESLVLQSFGYLVNAVSNSTLTILA